MTERDASNVRDAAMSRRRAAALLPALIVALTAAAVGGDTRAVRAWPLPGTALDSPEESRRAVSAAAESGIDTVLVPIPLEGLDAARAEALETFIDDARGRGLRIHAMVPALAATGRGDLPIARTHIIYRHPEWLMVPRELAVELLELEPRNPEYLGRLARWTRANADRTDAIYLSPLQPEAVDYIADSVAQIARRFAVDGIHLAGLQYPGPNFDYGRRTLDLFRTTVRETLSEPESERLEAIQAIDPFGYTAERADEWRRFRVARLTALVARLRTTVRAIRPQAIVSAGVIAGAEQAFQDHLQDWRTWLDNRFVDALGAGAAPPQLLFSYDSLLEPAGAGASATPVADTTR
jgi:hypothetical protein